MHPLELRIESAVSPSAVRLISALDAEIGQRYPDLPVRGLEDDFDARGGVFIVGYWEGEPAACGAFRKVDDNAEMKRIFVVGRHRGRGLARAVMTFLEGEAARRGFTRAILETGIGQPEAIALYRSSGWTEIPRFGTYANEEASVCFEKRLVGGPR